jgi:hypothetical protein
MRIRLFGERLAFYTPTITITISCSDSSASKGELKVLIAERVAHDGRVIKHRVDKKKMHSYGKFLVILGDAQLNAFFHLLGIKRQKIVD